MNKALITLISIVALMGLVSSVIFPEPFNQEEGTAIVIGNQDDMDAAEEIRDFLRGENFSSDSFQFARASNRLNLGENLTSVQTGIIDDDELPALLARGTYRADDGETYDYDQEITMGDLLFTVFAENDFNEGDPTPGIFIQDNDHVLNYTIDFVDPVESEISNGRLTNLEDTQIEILGKEYTIITAESDNTIEMLSGASEGSLELGETSDFIVDGRRFTIESVFINADEARFRVNNQLTPGLEEGETTEIQGTTIAVTEIDYQDFAGGVQRVQFLIGASKLTLNNGEEIDFEDDTIEGLISHIDSTVSGESYTLRSITFDWNADDDLFVTAGNSTANLPALGNLSLIMTDFVIPLQEEFEVRTDGDDTIVIDVQVEDSDGDTFELPILFSDGSTFVSTGGDEDTDLLLSSSEDTVTWEDDRHEYLVVSWDEENAAESYILSLDIGTDQGEDVVDFRNLVTSTEEESNIRAGDVARFGQIEITVESIDEDNETAVISLNEGASFNNLYTAEGLKITLPTQDNLTGNDTQFILILTEEDEDGNVGAGESFEISLNVNPSTDEVEVGTIQNSSEIMAGGILGSLEDDDDILLGWIESPLASEIRIDTSNQGTATVSYHGSESYGRVYLASGSNIIDSNVTVDIIFASEIEDAEDMNLIVVGGSCVNNISAQLLGVDFPFCSDDWEEETDVGEGQFIIRTFDSPFNEERVATLVAGYNREDTLEGARYLTEERIDISSGEEFIGGKDNRSNDNGSDNQTNNSTDQDNTTD